MNLLFILLFFITSHAFSASRDICDILDLQNCSGVSKQGRRSSALSLPSPSTSVLLNPANTSFNRGLGIEAIHQTGNPVIFNIATGTGKIGAALISTSMENTFFGNRVPESDEDFFRRKKDKKQYRTKKISLAFAGKLVRKRNLSLDAGIILKRHSEIKRVNPGAGLSGRLGPLTFGTSVYQDDFHLDLTGYQEKFTVVTYSVGTKIKNLSLDYGVISTKYEQDSIDTKVTLTSASYIAGDFMFNLALRNENSPAPKFVNGELRYQENKSDVYGGVQASLGRFLIVGVNYNYFLLEEVSTMAALFF
jgi:hypothetical protein